MVLQKLFNGWRTAVLAAIALVLSISVCATWLDWSANPGGVFRTGETTNMEIVLETFFSWILPGLLIAIPVSLATTMAVNAIRRRMAHQVGR